MLDLFPSRDAGPFGRRLRRERGARIPVTVVTGFLGAGKTTLIWRFLRSPEGAGTAVIVNEFGAVGIDDALIRDSAEETVLLGNGCVCCITRTDLQVALRKLLFDRERGTVPPFARVVIETSGLADPAPILHTLMTDPIVAARYMLDGVVTTVDSVNGAGTLDKQPEAVKQAAVADREIAVVAEGHAAPDALRRERGADQAVVRGAGQLRLADGALLEMYAAPVEVRGHRAAADRDGVADREVALPDLADDGEGAPRGEREAGRHAERQRDAPGSCHRQRPRARGSRPVREGLAGGCRLHSGHPVPR